MTPAEKLAVEKKEFPHKPRAIRRAWNCNLYDLRTALNLTQCDVADAVGLSQAGYNKIENTGNDVCLSTAVKLSEFFGKQITEIWSKV